MIVRTGSKVIDYGPTPGRSSGGGISGALVVAPRRAVYPANTAEGKAAYRERIRQDAERYARQLERERLRYREVYVPVPASGRCRKNLHDMTPDNTVHRPEGTVRCRTCRNDYARARYARAA